jgi:hypothetical protein
MNARSTGGASAPRRDLATRARAAIDSARRSRATLMAVLISAIGVAMSLPILASSAHAESHDRLTRRDGSSLEGEVVTLSLSDVGFLPKGKDTVLQIPRAEVHEIQYANGTTIAGGGLYGGDEHLSLRASYAREIERKPYLSEEKLSLSKRDVADRAILRGFLVAGVATMFTKGESKKIVFPAVFVGQFVLAYLTGL